MDNHHVSFDMDSQNGPDPDNKIQELQISTVEETNPPSYTNKSNGSPPSYASMLNQLKEAKDGSGWDFNFATKAIGIVTCGGLCNVGVTFLFWVLTLACIGMGAAHIDNCPKTPMIPKYLIVFGTFYTIKVMFAVLKGLRNRYEDNPEDKELPAYLKGLDGLLDCFLAVWFIVGNVYVYSTNGKYQSDDPSAADYCNRDLYLFAFWVITFQYILTLLFICLGCCLVCVFCCMMGKQSKDLV